jgi:hypothetical protein
MARSRRTSADLILPMLFGAFKPPSPCRGQSPTNSSSWEAHADLSSTAWQEIGVKPGFACPGVPWGLSGIQHREAKTVWWLLISTGSATTEHS